MTETKQPKIGIAKIYLKDLSFESPAAPAVFQKPWKPAVNIQVTVNHRQINEKIYEVTLLLNIEAKSEDQIVAIVEVEQAGLFEVIDASQQQLDHILKVFCPTTLFPYARQAIDATLNGGGFPSMMLSPINFEASAKAERPSQPN